MEVPKPTSRVEIVAAMRRIRVRKEENENLKDLFEYIFSMNIKQKR